MAKKTVKKATPKKVKEKKQVKKTNKKKTFNKMDFFLLVDLVLIIVFTIVNLVFTVKGYYINDNLILSVFGVLGGELGIMGWIKSNKEKVEARKIELADRKYFEKLNKENKGDE